jgi:hypothetical protein
MITLGFPRSSRVRKFRPLKRLILLAIIVSVIYLFLPPNEHHKSEERRDENKGADPRDSYILIGKDSLIGPASDPSEEKVNKLKEEQEIPDHLLSSIGESVKGGESKRTNVDSNDDEYESKQKNVQSLNQKVDKLTI